MSDHSDDSIGFLNRGRFEYCVIGEPPKILTKDDIMPNLGVDDSVRLADTLLKPNPFTLEIDSKNNDLDRSDFFKNESACSAKGSYAHVEGWDSCAVSIGNKSMQYESATSISNSSSNNRSLTFDFDPVVPSKVSEAIKNGWCRDIKTKDLTANMSNAFQNLQLHLDEASIVIDDLGRSFVHRISPYVLPTELALQSLPKAYSGTTIQNMFVDEYTSTPPDTSKKEVNGYIFNEPKGDKTMADSNTTITFSVNDLLRAGIAIPYDKIKPNSLKGEKDFKLLSDEEVAKLSRSELRKYNRKKNEYEKSCLDAARKRMIKVETLVPKKITTSGLYTIFYWSDGDQTIVKRAVNEEPNDYFAYCAAIVKKLFGNNSQVHSILKSVERSEIVPKAKKNKVEPKKEKVTKKTTTAAKKPTTTKKPARARKNVKGEEVCKSK